jgi:hypothetical protein
MNNKNDFKPYFLSARHCISRQSEADSLEIQWNYLAISCDNSKQRDSTSYPYSGGAELLYQNEKTDTAFLFLKNFKLRDGGGSPRFAYWDATPQNLGGVYSFHYPAGDMEKYSSGSLELFTTNELQCLKDGTCTPSKKSTNPDDSLPYYMVKWDIGSTEGGSSGGPLFSNRGYLIGQLRGGVPNQATCDINDSRRPNQNMKSYFGRFDLAYKEKDEYGRSLSTWLDPKP